MSRERTDSIVAVTVCKYATMYVEAETPEEAMKYAKKYCNDVDDWDFDGDVEVDSCDNYTTNVDVHMEKIWIEEGQTLDFDEYMEQLEEQEE